MLNSVVARPVWRGAVAVLAGSVFLLPAHAAEEARHTVLGIQETHFTLDGAPTFLYGISYYGALGAADATVTADLDALQKLGLNWLRVWATWSGFGEDVSAVDGDGAARQPYLDRLVRLVAECDRRGMVVDVTLCRGDGPGRLPSLEPHRRAVALLLTTLAERRNWYLDLANERNIGDARRASFADLQALRRAARETDPKRLITASQGGDIGPDELREYLFTAEVDFITPHRPRGPGTAAETEGKTREYLAWMKELGRVVPVHYQEPFRRGYQDWQPTAEDFATDLHGAQVGGAAGWCLHNGSTRGVADEQPRRSFDLRAKGLFEQLDAEELRALRQLAPQ